MVVIVVIGFRVQGLGRMVVIVVIIVPKVRN